MAGSTMILGYYGLSADIIYLWHKYSTRHKILWSWKQTLRPHDIEALSTLLCLFEGNSPVESFEVLFLISLNKLLNITSDYKCNDSHW